MEHRRDFLSMLAGLGAVSCELQADDPPRRTRAAGVIQLPPPLDKQNATFSELYIEPGKHSTPHRHAGFVLGYVIEGEFRFQISGEPERILRAGDIFYEPPGVTHLVSESASAAKPARVLAIIIADSETKKLTEPA
jgi:quercetin dioxygenase-like cupin family protein